MAEVTGSIEGIIESLEKQRERASAVVKARQESIRAGRYGAGWQSTKTDLISEQNYAQGEAWALTRCIDLLGTLNALMFHELNKTRLPDDCCTTCGAEQDARPVYCITEDCNSRAKMKVRDAHGNEWDVCLGHLELTLNGVGESTVVPL